VLSEIERGEAGGYLTSSTDFFELVRQHALEGMFGDPSWGGNAGMVGWALLGYQGPKQVWSEEEQQLANE
jgi:gluconate 2-dehydrogenase gamma chain